MVSLAARWPSREFSGGMVPSVTSLGLPYGLMRFLGRAYVEGDKESMRVNITHHY